MQTNKRRNSNSKLMGLIFTLAGAAIFWFFSLPPLKYSLESKSWPVTSGTITRSEV